LQSLRAMYLQVASQTVQVEQMVNSCRFFMDAHSINFPELFAVNYGFDLSQFRMAHCIEACDFALNPCCRG